MTNSTKKLFVGALMSGLVLGAGALANEVKKDAAHGKAKHCKHGDKACKDNCQGHKDKCDGKDGCKGADGKDKADEAKE